MSQFPAGQLSCCSVFRIAVLAAFALQLSAQTQAPGDPSFHVSVNLVQVDAVVTDSKGHPVRELTRSALVVPPEIDRVRNERKKPS